MAWPLEAHEGPTRDTLMLMMLLCSVAGSSSPNPEELRQSFPPTLWRHPSCPIRRTFCLSVRSFRLFREEEISSSFFLILSFSPFPSVSMPFALFFHPSSSLITPICPSRPFHDHHGLHDRGPQIGSSKTFKSQISLSSTIPSTIGAWAHRALTHTLNASVTISQVLFSQKP